MSPPVVEHFTGKSEPSCQGSKCRDQKCHSMLACLPGLIKPGSSPRQELTPTSHAKCPVRSGVMVEPLVISGNEVEDIERP